MKPQEREVLEKLSLTAELETWIRCARAELASDPHNALLQDFIRLVERMRNEKQADRLASTLTSQ